MQYSSIVPHLRVVPGTPVIFFYCSAFQSRDFWHTILKHQTICIPLDERFSWLGNHQILVFETECSLLSLRLKQCHNCLSKPKVLHQPWLPWSWQTSTESKEMLRRSNDNKYLVELASISSFTSLNRHFVLFCSFHKINQDVDVVQSTLQTPSPVYAHTLTTSPWLNTLNVMYSLAVMVSQKSPPPLLQLVHHKVCTYVQEGISCLHFFHEAFIKCCTMMSLSTEQHIDHQCTEML